MEKQPKQSLWHEAFKLSKQSIRGLLPDRWEIMRLAIAIIFVVVGSSIAVVFGIVQGWDVAGKIVLGVFGGEVALVLLFWFSTWFIAVVRTPWFASIVAETKDNEIREQKDLVEYLKQLERLGRAELIKLDKAKDKEWLGVEIVNGEKDNPFNGVLYIKSASNYKVRSPIKVEDRFGGSIHVLPNNNKETVKIAHFQENQGIVVVPSFGSDIKYDETGEYIIETTLEGRFLSGTYDTAYKDNKWKIISLIKKRVGLI